MCLRAGEIVAQHSSMRYNRELSYALLIIEPSRDGCCDRSAVTISRRVWLVKQRTARHITTRRAIIVVRRDSHACAHHDQQQKVSLFALVVHARRLGRAEIVSSRPQHPPRLLLLLLVEFVERARCRPLRRASFSATTAAALAGPHSGRRREAVLALQILAPA